MSLFSDCDFSDSFFYDTFFVLGYSVKKKMKAHRKKAVPEAHANLLSIKHGHLKNSIKKEVK